MLIFLVFETYETAHQADVTITVNMNLSEGSNWGEPRQRINGDWVIPKPEDRWMDGVTGYAEKEYSPNWFPIEEL